MTRQFKNHPVLTLAVGILCIAFVRGCSERANDVGPGQMGYAQYSYGANAQPVINETTSLPQANQSENGWHYAGPGGYAGGEGKTFYYNDPDSGSSVMIGE